MEIKCLILSWKKRIKYDDRNNSSKFLYRFNSRNIDWYISSMEYGLREIFIISGAYFA